MARPRKDAEGATARQRIIDAFWHLLEDRPVHDIVVGAVSDAACCNRGTFYYYFPDMNALVASAIREEFFSDDALARAVSGILAGGDAKSIMRSISPRRTRRISLIMRAGGERIVEVAVRDAVHARWRERLCEEGCDLEPASVFAIQFMVGGLLGYFSYMVQVDDAAVPLDADARRYLRQVARATVQAVSDAQGLDPQDVKARLRCGVPKEPMDDAAAS